MPTDEKPPADVVGSIAPPEDGEGAPIFEVIGRREDYRIATIGVANVRPCDHTSGKVTYILDEKFQTVTCSKCQAQIPAFAVLMLYNEWNRHHRRDKAAAESAERSLHVANLRRIQKLRGVTPAEGEEIKQALLWYGNTPPRQLMLMAARIEDALQDRKDAAERMRNPVKGTLPPTQVFGG